MSPAQAAKKVRKVEPKTPEELALELARHEGAELKFAGLSPSCRREYIQWIEEAKRPETRTRRATEAAGWIAQGKKRNWKEEGR